MATKNNKPPKEKPKAGVEIGASGTNTFSGIITEEYIGELSGTRAMKVYDEMRKSDATVKAALLAIQLPIRRASWFVQPASEDKADVEIADFVNAALFNYPSITWDDFLRQALLSTAYGVMIFEKVFGVKDDKIIWTKFAPRLPKSVQAWQMKNGEAGIQQTTTTGVQVEIPMEKLLVFVQEKEGDNWWGISCLRAAYKHWYIKSNLEKIDAIAHERQGLGVPFVKLPSGATDEDKRAAETVLSNMRANEEGYLVEPDNITVEFKDMKASGTKDASRAIDYHDRRITMAVLAQFLSLGSGASGSYALSQDHSDLFLQSLGAIANNICDVINKYAIPQLVDLNFSNVKDYPRLDFAGLNRENVNELSTAYQRLVQSGGIKPFSGDDKYLRDALGLPENTDELETDDEPADDNTDEKPEDVVEDLGLSELANKKKVETSVNRRLSEIPTHAGRLDFLEDAVARVRKLTAKHPETKELERVLSENLGVLKRKVFQEKNDFASWRTLTFAEKKVNWDSVQTFIDKTEAGLMDDGARILKQATEEYLNKLSKAVNSGDNKKVKDLEVPYFADYKACIKEYLKKSFDFGKNNASREMDVKAPGNSGDVSKTIDLMAETIAWNHYTELENNSKIALANEMQKFGEKEIKALAAAGVAIATGSDKLLRNTAAIVVASTLNKGRSFVFSKNADKIHALQRSEILDEVTCNFCLSMDGRIVEPDDDIAKQETFHSNCRGIWVEILKDEQELPEVTGVPDGLRDRLGDAVNELVQPKKPIVKKDGLADQFLDDDEDGEKDASELKSTHPRQHAGCGHRH